MFTAQTEWDCPENFPDLSEGEVRLMVYEDLRDSLKYLMTDVSY